MPTGKQDEAVMKADQSLLEMEGIRADLNDPRGYGNCFVDAWKWLKGKFRGRTH